MPPVFKQVVEAVGYTIDAAGVLVILVGLVIATVRFGKSGRQRADPYRSYRQDVGRGILLGLEFLVAADIIRTVALEPSLQNVLVLGMVVIIRTFLSMSLEIELEGRLPWHRSD